MTSASETFAVDLGSVRSEEQLLELLGDALKLEFANSSAFRMADPVSYSILLEVLETVRARYAHDGIEFAYVFR